MFDRNQTGNLALSFFQASCRFTPLLSELPLHVISLQMSDLLVKLYSLLKGNISYV